MLVKDVIYPFLVANTKSIVEAKRLCYEVQQALTQVFQTKIAEVQAAASNQSTVDFVITDITKKGKGFKVNKELAALFASEKLTVTNALLGGMSAAIDSFVNEELAHRGLDTIKATFL